MTNIRVDVLSPVEFEDVLAEIYISDAYFGRITQEHGDNLRMLDLDQPQTRQFEVREVLEGIAQAVQRLDAMGKKRSPSRE